MPTKKSKKQTQVVKQKQQVKQVVNVKIGDVKAKRKQVRRVKSVAKLPEPAPALLRQAPINVSLSTQSYTPSQPSYLNEYNTLLKQLTEERIARQRNAPPLAPNTNPLTINQQRNELLSRIEKEMKQETPLAKETKPILDVLEDVVKKETYDDPLTNENMFVNPPRLAEQVNPKLMDYFNYDDIDEYAAENENEQNALEKEVEEEKKVQEEKKVEKEKKLKQEKPKKKIRLEDEEGNLILTTSQVEQMSREIVEGVINKATKKPTQKEKLLKETNDLIKFWNLEVNDAIPEVTLRQNKKTILEQKNRLKNLIDDRGLKISKIKR